MKTKWFCNFFIFFALPLLSGCSATGFVNALTPRNSFEIERDIAYGDGVRQKLDIYRPTNADSNVPAILFFYGGRWQFGEKSDYLFVAEALASRGFIVGIADYRLFPEVRWQGIVNDAVAATAKFAKTIPDKTIVLAGHSAGAYLATMVALDQQRHSAAGVDSCNIAGVMGLAGPYDFLPITEPDIIEVFGPGQAGPKTMPIYYVNGKAPPMLLLSGAADDTVKPGNTRRLAAALQAAGADVETRFYDDVNHIDIVASLSRLARFLSPALQDMVDFSSKLPIRQAC